MLAGCGVCGGGIALQQGRFGCSVTGCSLSVRNWLYICSGRGALNYN